MSIEEPKIGEVVRLLSGGTLMTITNIGFDRGGNYEFKCVWFDSADSLHDSTFRGRVLQRCRSNE
jgi:uncharacterized protein YodC (DUF2158 family)